MTFGNRATMAEEDVMRRDRSGAAIDRSPHAGGRRKVVPDGLQVGNDYANKSRIADDSMKFGQGAGDIVLIEMFDAVG